MKPDGLISRIVKRLEPAPAPPPPSAYQKHGGWNNARSSAGGAVSHLSPEESAEASRAGAEALVEMQRQKDNNPGGPLYDVHL